MAVQLARELGARVIGTGRAADREAALGLGANVFVDLQADRLEEAGELDVVFDVIGGEVLERLAPLVRVGGTLVTIIGPPKVRPAEGRAIFFVVEPDRLQLAHLAERVRSGRLHPIIGAVRPLAEAAAAFTPDRRIPGKTIIRVTEGEITEGGYLTGRRTGPGRPALTGKTRGGRPTGWPPGDAATSTKPAKPASAGMPAPRQHHDHNELQLP